MKYPVISEEEMIRRLAPPKGLVNMVLDTDAANEIDDQFAIAYALMSPERLNVSAVYAAPFSGAFYQKFVGEDVDAGQTKDLKESVRQSYDEAMRVFEYLGMPYEGRLFMGSDSYMTERDVPVESPAARDLVEKAMSCDALLYVVAIAESTNIASAILMEPAIVDRIVVLQLAGQPLHCKSALEFNLCQDIYASQVILDCGVPYVLIPGMGVASHLSTSVPELKERMAEKSRIGTFLCENVKSILSTTPPGYMMNMFKYTFLSGWDDYDKEIEKGFETTVSADTRIIWDISPIGYLINPNWVPSSLMRVPRLTDDARWEHDNSRHLMRICNFVHRDLVFGDMFMKLENAI